MDEYIKSLNEVLNKLSLSLRGSTYKIIDDISIINEDIFTKEPLKTICSHEIFSLVIIAIWVALIYITTKSVLSLYSDIAIEKIWYLILKCIIVAIFSINSYHICKSIININSKITNVLTKSIEETTNYKIEYKFLDDNIDSLDELITNKDKLSLSGVKDGIVCFYIISLLLIFSLRLVIVISCIIISPIVSTFLLIPNLEKYFYTYIRVFIYNLLLQNINTLLLYIPISAKNEKSLFLPVVIGSIILIYNVNKKAGTIIFEKKN